MPVQSRFQFVTSIAMVGVGTLSSSLFQVLSARNLTAPEYGRLATALAIIGVMGVAGSGVQFSSAQDGLAAIKQEDMMVLRGRSALIILTLAFIAIATAIQLFFALSWRTSSVVGGFVWVVLLLGQTNAHLQVHFPPVFLHGFAALNSITRLLFGLFTIVIWRSVSLALGAQLLVTALVCLSVTRITQVSIPVAFTTFSRHLPKSTVVVLLSWIIGNIDLLLTRAFFDGTTAGNVAIGSTFGNVLLIGSSFVSLTFFAWMITQHEMGHSALKSVVKLGIGVLCLNLLLFGVLLGFRNVIFSRIYSNNYEIAQDIFGVQLFSYLLIGLLQILLLSLLVFRSAVKTWIVMLLVIPLPVVVFAFMTEIRRAFLLLNVSYFLVISALFLYLHQLAAAHRRKDES